LSLEQLCSPLYNAGEFMAFRLSRRNASVLVGAAALAVSLGVVALPDSASAGPPDGATSASAALSCWAIKQSYPSSPTGLYWLKTPWLSSAQQFYCDMTTDGGGWVLVGRGRENWQFTYAGQGSAKSVANIPTGATAFSPAAVPGDTINALYDGQKIDEVRLRRAENTAGTAWQNVRFRYADQRDWSWTFDGGLRLSSASFDGLSYSGEYTSDIVHDSSIRPYNRVTTTKSQYNAWKKGFAYGTYVTGGSTSASSYLWRNSSTGTAVPFTQVYIRPKLTTASSAPAPVHPKLVSGKTSPTSWGVTGVVGGGTGENNIEVHALGVVGGTLYVGGKFQYVQKGATPGPGEKVEQFYLAAFDTATGAWKSGFRPKLDGEVWAIKGTGDKLIVSGDFTNVNAAPNTAGVAALNLDTGAPLATWKASLIRGSGTPRGRALDIQDGWVYIGGTFDHIKGGSTITKSPFWVGGAARVKLTDGTPDTTWNPFFDAGVYTLDAGSQGDRVYFGGRFEHMGKQQQTLAHDFTVVSTAAPGDHVSGLADQSWTPSTDRVGGAYRQTVLETGDRVWLGGSEHDFQAYSRDFTQKISGNIARAGGDFQSSVEINGVVYAGSHGFDFIYNGASTYPDPKTGGYTNVHRLNMVGAWDAKTGEYLPNWNPGFASRAGNGVWALTEDNNGCMWAGGDLKSGSWAGTGYQWLGGFGKFCP
jgi:trimeric autotransporter adhesin